MPEQLISISSPHRPLKNLPLTLPPDCVRPDTGQSWSLEDTSTNETIPLQADGFGFDAEITGRIFRKKLRVYEVPISYDGRSYEAGKKLRWTDAFVLLYWLVR